MTYFLPKGQVWKRVWTWDVRSENGHGKWHFLVCNRVRIWRTKQHAPWRIPRSTPLPPAPRWFWSVLSSCMTTGRISLNNGSILVVHCLIGRLLCSSLWLHYFFSLWGFYSFMFFFTSEKLSVMEHFGCKHMAAFMHLPSSHDKTV